MGRLSQQAAYQVHTFNGERIKGIRVRVHGYPVELQPLTDGAWQAIVPELPGCASEGDSMVEAIANIAGAIASSLEVAD